MSLDDFYFAINDVRPSLIRVEADEATYNLHIIIRFELEQALLSRRLAGRRLARRLARQVPASIWASNQPTTPTAAAGHSLVGGLIGYFPTYSLGNLYAAQFFEQADSDLGGLAAQFARGEFTPLKRVAAAEDPPPRPVLHGRGTGAARHRGNPLATPR